MIELRILIFQGQSQYDVLRESSRRTAGAFRELGHETFIFDMMLWTPQDYLNIIQEFKPDFTFGSNPVCYYINEKLHYEYTNIPHFVRLGDSPYYHLFDRALRDPNHPLVYTLGAETSFIKQMNDMGFDRISRLKTFASEKVFQHEDVHAYRPYPVVFFGSIKPPEEYIKSAKQNLRGSVRANVLDFIAMLPEWMEQRGIFLPVPIDQCFAEFLQLEDKVSIEDRNMLLRTVYPYIDGYYRNYTREHVLTQFAEHGVPMYVFGNDYIKQKLSPYKHVRSFNPVSFKQCLEIYAKSKVVLNITPMFFYAHERISHSITNGAVLCSSLMPDLIDEIPEMLESSLFYTWGTIGDTAEAVKQVLDDPSLRMQLVGKCKQITEQYFEPKRNAEEIIAIYRQVFCEQS